jgi:hypothetical protein
VKFAFFCVSGKKMSILDVRKHAVFIDKIGH